MEIRRVRISQKIETLETVTDCVVNRGSFTTRLGGEVG